MYRACVAVVDAVRARLFTFERVADGAGTRETFTEVTDLVDVERRLRPGELFSEARPGISHSLDTSYGLDDHRDKHLDELDARFARLTIAELSRLVEQHPPQRLVICASPRMLGHLRDASESLRRSDLEVIEVPRDLVKLARPHLREQLAMYRALPSPPRQASATD